MSKVVILGAGGHARVIADIIEACGDEVTAFLDDDPKAQLRSGKIGDYVRYEKSEFIIGIGDAAVREKLSELPVKWYTAVHPSAIISKSAKICEGTAVMPCAVINSGAYVGKHCIINTSAVVEHDDTVEDYAHISVGVKLGGTVHIGKSTWVGIGATVRNNIDICGGCMIGAGAVVTDNIREKGQYVGLPAGKVK